MIERFRIQRHTQDGGEKNQRTGERNVRAEAECVCRQREEMKIELLY